MRQGMKIMPVGATLHVGDGRVGGWAGGWMGWEEVCGETAATCCDCPLAACQPAGTCTHLGA